MAHITQFSLWIKLWKEIWINVAKNLREHLMSTETDLIYKKLCLIPNMCCTSYTPYVLSVFHELMYLYAASDLSAVS